MCLRRTLPRYESPPQPPSTSSTVERSLCFWVFELSFGRYRLTVESCFPESLCVTYAGVSASG